MQKDLLHVSDEAFRSIEEIAFDMDVRVWVYFQKSTLGSGIPWRAHSKTQGHKCKTTFLNFNISF